ncbi:MAG: HIT family protein [Anaeromyxobacteraceae bacterium]|nr:HIT family protein [Anaeromyxobacteraceae bacterium]
MGDARCGACDLLAGGHSPPGGIVWRGEGFALHALDGPSPLPGWLVLTAERHARALHDLDAASTAALGPLAQRVMRLQRELLGAEHVYLFAIGDLLHHAHFHLVPRYAATPERLRGRGAFEARPDDLRSPVELAAAARLVGEALGG